MGSLIGGMLVWNGHKWGKKVSWFEPQSNTRGAVGRKGTALNVVTHHSQQLSSNLSSIHLLELFIKVSAIGQFIISGQVS